MVSKHLAVSLVYFVCHRHYMLIAGHCISCCINNLIMRYFLSSDTYCCVEVDSFGHFFLKAKTNTLLRTAEPSWDEAFEIDLEGSQTLRLLCYKDVMGEEAPELVGKCALEVGENKPWLTIVGITSFSNC